MANTNPFLVYRERLDSYAPVRAGVMTDAEFVEIVEGLDAAINEVEGHGFSQTPVSSGAAIAEALGLDIDLHIKAEPHNVGGSHKARHLFGIALHLLVAEAQGAPVANELAIASCGNAAMGAGVIAAALKRPLQVYVPQWADEVVVAKLKDLGASINHCERREGEAGDPAYLRFAEAVAAGATAFSVQGTDQPHTFDGGRTLGWEFEDQVSGIEALFIQVGGGALSTAVSTAMESAKLFPVQAEGCAPLKRAWDLLSPKFDWDYAEANQSEFMWPWDNPSSFATGILDDITYDWFPLLKRTLVSGGEPIVAPEETIVKAHAMAHELTDIPVCSTGASGLAGLMTAPPPAGTKVGLIFSGIER